MCVGLMLGVWTAAAWAQAPSSEAVDALGPPAEATPTSVERAVSLLGAMRYADREAAERWLWAAGGAAVKALRQAAEHDDPEVVMRARRILPLVEAGIGPEADKAVVEAYRLYEQTADAHQKIRAGQVLARSLDGARVLRRLLEGETDQQVRRELEPRVRRWAVSFARDLIAGGKLDQAIAELDATAAAGDLESARHLAALLHQTGGLADHIKTLEADASAGHRAMRLMALHRAGGDLATALAWAERATEQAGDDDAVNASRLRAWADGLRMRLGRWDQVTASLQTRDNRDRQFQGLAQAMTLKRLAGKPLELGPGLRWQALREAIDSDSTALQFAELLLVNDLPDVLAEGLVDEGELYLAMQLAWARGRLVEAVELARRLIADGAPEPSRTRQIAHLLASVGQKQQAIELIDRDMASHPTLIAALWEIGAEQVAADRTEALLEQPFDASHWQVIRAIDRGRLVRNGGALWFQVLSEHDLPGDRSRYQNLRRLVASEKVDDAAVDAAIAWFDSSSKPQPMERVADLYQYLQTRGQGERGYRLLKKQVEQGGREHHWTTLGEIAMARERWTDAVEAYRRAMGFDPATGALNDDDTPVRLLDYARALGRQAAADADSAQAAEAKRMLRLATLLPLADEHQRHLLAQAMTEHRMQGAAEQWRLLAHTGDVDSWYAYRAEEQVIAEHQRAGRFDRALALRERHRLWLLEPSVGVALEGMVAMGRQIGQLRERALLADGRYDAALAEALANQKRWPGGSDTTIGTVEAFDRADRSDLGDRLFDVAFTHLAAEAEAFPKSPTLNNQAAWVAARCRRSLGKALTFARRAVEAEPGLHAAIDTLAEVHFQLGHDKQAIELMRRCIELAPDNAYYQRQLERMQAGQRQTPPPE